MTGALMVGWNHLFSGHEFEQTPGDSERQGSLARRSPWGHRVRHNLATEQQQQGSLERVRLFRPPEKCGNNLHLLTAWWQLPPLGLRPQQPHFVHCLRHLSWLGQWLRFPPLGS